MNAEGFKDWLLSSGQMKSAAENRVANCITVEREQRVDLDVCYVNDRCEHLLYLLTYSREDQRRKNLPRHCIHIDGDIYNGTATYKSAVKKYVAFKDAGGTVLGKPISPKKVPPKVEGNARMPNDKTSRDNFNRILQDFHRWLSDGNRIPRSAGSYVSYIKSLRNAVNQKFGPGWFERIMINDYIGTSRQKRFCCSAFIEHKIRTSTGGIRKNWHNWRSGFNKFEDFLDWVADLVTWKPEEEPEAARHIAQMAKIPCAGTPVDQNANSQSCVQDDVPVRCLDHRELFNKFKSRLTTQRRLYPNICIAGATCGVLFSPKLIGRVFGRGRNSVWSRWLRDGIENIHVLCSEAGEWIPFSDVMRIEIYNDCRMIVTRKDGATFDLQTRTHDCRIKTEQVVLCDCGETAPNWSDISIDHVRPLENVLREHIDQMPGIRLLSQKFAEFTAARKGTLDGRKDYWVNDLYEYYREELDTDDLRNLLADDLWKIYEYGGGYELMDSRENSIKGMNGVPFSTWDCHEWIRQFFYAMGAYLQGGKSQYSLEELRAHCDWSKFIGVTADQLDIPKLVVGCPWFVDRPECAHIHLEPHVWAAYLRDLSDKDWEKLITIRPQLARYRDA